MSEPETTTTARRGWSPGTIAMLAGGAAIIGGSVAPWAQVSAGIFSRSIGGMDGDGKLTLAAGVLIVILALVASASPGRGASVTVLLLGLVAGGIAIYDTVNVADKAQQAENTSSLVTANVGWGLYVVMGGAAIALVGALMRSGEKRTESADRAATTSEGSLLRPCPWCAEKIQPAAQVCRYCGREVEPLATTFPAPAVGTGEQWLADPSGRYPDRWWDGAVWTQWVRDQPGGTRSEDPPVPWTA